MTRRERVRCKMSSARGTRETAATVTGLVAGDEKEPEVRWVTKLYSMIGTGGRAGTLLAFVGSKNQRRGWQSGSLGFPL